jgi:hypothetical protein
MGMPVNTPRTWRFGVFELDASSGELRRNGTVVKLREQPARILLLLLEHAGQQASLHRNHPEEGLSLCRAHFPTGGHTEWRGFVSIDCGIRAGCIHVGTE